MTSRIALFKRRCWAWLVFYAVLALAVAHRLTQPLWDDPVIALELGGTYENMREHSTAPFSPLNARVQGIWGGMPKTDARLRFVDPQYGFETPLARFLSVGFNDNVVDDIRMSPQIEPLLIDDAMKVVLDLQAQWCAKGWRPIGTRRNPTIADTPEWRAYIRFGELAGQSYWQAGDKYQAMLILGRFRRLQVSRSGTLPHYPRYCGAVAPIRRRRTPLRTSPFLATAKEGAVHAGFECIGTIHPKSRRNGGRLMIKRFSGSNGSSWVRLALCVILAMVAGRQLMQPFWGDPVIALQMGGPYEYMEAHSTASFSIWGRGSKRFGRYSEDRCASELYRSAIRVRDAAGSFFHGDFRQQSGR